MKFREAYQLKEAQVNTGQLVLNLLNNMRVPGNQLSDELYDALCIDNHERTVLPILGKIAGVGAITDTDYKNLDIDFGGGRTMKMKALVLKKFQEAQEARGVKSKGNTQGKAIARGDQW